MEKEIECHPWTPYIPYGAKILFVGSFPPDSSKWSMEFYYPNWINDFWRIMGLLYYDDKDHFCDIASKSFKLNDIKAFLQEQKIAVGDMAVEVRRLKGNASDKFLEIVTPLSLGDVLQNMPECRALVATGEKAAQEIAMQMGIVVPNVGEYVEVKVDGGYLRVYRMPSTSRAYPLALTKKAEHYRKLFVEMGML